MRSVLTAALAIAATGGSIACDGSAPERPNVLFIAVDDLRPELGAYGAPAITPNLDRLAEEGMRFDSAFAQAAACAASRATLLTGAYPHTTGVYSTGPPLAKSNPKLVAMPRLFEDAGYEVVEVGKFMHVPEDAPGAWSRERWMPPWDPPEYHAPENRKHNGRMTPPRGPFSEHADAPDSTYLDAKLAAHAIEELRRLRDTPFFLAVGFIRPHLPFICPGEYWDLYDEDAIVVPEAIPLNRVSIYQWHGNYEPAAYEDGQKIDAETGRRMIHGYRACVSYIDAQVGRLLDELNRLDLSDRTIVVLWGDHGLHLGEHGIWGKNTALDASLRIPLLVRAPGYAGGQSTAALVETVDILPTLCELAGIPIPEQVEGVSFVPLLTDPNRPWKQAAFGWREWPNRSGRTVRTPRYRFVRWVPPHSSAARAPVELYDHASDPREYVDVAGRPEYAQTVEELNDLLDAWLRHDPRARFRPE